MGIPIGIFFLIWRYAMKKMGPGMGVMSFSKSKAKIFAESETKVNFDDAAGIDAAKEEIWKAHMQSKKRLMGFVNRETGAAMDENILNDAGGHDHIRG